MPCNPKNPKANSDQYICNPNTNRWVKRNGKVGKSLLPNSRRRSRRAKTRKSRRMRKKRRSVERKAQDRFPVYLNEMVMNETNFIAEGGFGSVYQVPGKNKVVKIVYAKKSKISKRLLHQLEREVRISKRIECAGLGPAIYAYGIGRNVHKDQEYFYILMRKLVYPTERVLCEPRNLVRLFRMYEKLSALGIMNRDPNVHNIMYDPVKKKLFFIDMGLAKELKNTQKAMRENMITLFRIALSFSGIGRQGKIKNCSNIDPLIIRLLDFAKKNRITHLSNMLKTSAHALRISDRLKQNLLS